MLSIKNSVGEPIPEFSQAFEEAGKVFPSVTRENTWDIFP
jgi:hypothetical protein